MAEPVRKGEPRYSLEEFAVMDLGGLPAELIDGRIVVAQAFPTEEHGIIVENLAHHLRLALDAIGETRCRPAATSALRIKGLEHGLPNDHDLGPDLTVRCRGETGERQPTLILEVLSPSNSANDMADKLHAYKAVPSVLDILYLNQDKYFGVHHQRRHGVWLTGIELVGPEAEIVIDRWNARIPLRVVYDQVLE
jgi:Uma2 family endonuclease